MHGNWSQAVGIRNLPNVFFNVCAYKFANMYMKHNVYSNSLVLLSVVSLLQLPHY